MSARKPPGRNQQRSKSSKRKSVESDRPPMARSTIPPALHDPEQRAEWQLPKSETQPGPYMIELNLLYKEGLQEANIRFKELYEKVLGKASQSRPPVPISKTYYRCKISVKEWRRLVKEDEKAESRHDRVIYRIWPDFPVKPLIDRSVATVKADAAVRAYAATGANIVWAVIDSGIESNHLHFGDPKEPLQHTLLHPDVADLHRDFSSDGPVTKETVMDALSDGFGHGTHVAGIISGGLTADMKSGVDFQAYEKVFESDPVGANKAERIEKRLVRDATQLRGVAPQCKLISLKVLNNDGAGRASNVMSALQYIREELNGDPKLLRVHGVNLSIGYEFDAEMFACGQSPLCVEVDRLVKSGVVVVVAAGNTGYGRVGALQRQTRVGLSNTINDPGNAGLAITVGATHRDSPHIYGVSYFSSKGPTGDGRLKPDLIAPGERITSCAAGRKLASQGGEVPNTLPAYIDDTGTSMAAPHVSGAIAAFLSIRREFIQRPEDVKRIFLESATALGRERYFEGHGLLDLMRAIQSV
jgi:serine protease AprX